MVTAVPLLGAPARAATATRRWRLWSSRDHGTGTRVVRGFRCVRERVEERGRPGGVVRGVGDGVSAVEQVVPEEVAVSAPDVDVALDGHDGHLGGPRPVELAR